MRNATKLGLISGYACKTTNAFRFFSFVVWYSWSSASLLYSETYKATKCKTRRLFVSIQLNFSKFLSTWLESIANCSICILQADIEAVVVLPTDNTLFVAINWLLLSLFHYQLGTFISNAKLRTKALLLDWNSAIVSAIVLVHYPDFLCCLSLSHLWFQSDPLPLDWWPYQVPGYKLQLLWRKARWKNVPSSWGTKRFKAEFVCTV